MQQLNNKLEGLHQKPDQVEETRWEGPNFSEVVVPQEEEEEEEKEDLLSWLVPVQPGQQTDPTVVLHMTVPPDDGPR